VITNPPFSLAEDFARQALKVAGAHGTVTLFLRLAFLEGAKRAAFHREHPADVYVLPTRPVFRPDLGADRWAYAWFVWGPGRGGRWEILDIEKPRARRGA
jgi:hypothetical protein